MTLKALRTTTARLFCILTIISPEKFGGKEKSRNFAAKIKNNIMTTATHQSFVRPNLKPLLSSLTVEDKLWVISFLAADIAEHKEYTDTKSEESSSTSLASICGVLDGAFPKEMSYDEIRQEAVFSKYGAV